MNSKNERRLGLIETKVFDTGGLVVMLVTEWQELVDQHGGDRQAVEKAGGGHVLRVVNPEDRDALAACLEAVKPPAQHEKN